MKATIAVIFLCLLTACGGGGDDEDGKPDKTTMPVDCKANPQSCQ